MWMIGALAALACAGVIYGAYLLRRERVRGVATIIGELERESGLLPAEAEGERRSALVRRLQRLMPAAVLEEYTERLTWIGRPYGLDAGQFAALKVILAATLPALIPALTLMQIDATTLVLMLLTAMVAFLLPDLWLNGRVGERKRLVQEELPLFTDLIATAVAAGLSLTEAVRRVAADAPGLVAREFLRSVQEMAAGKQRIEAWRSLMDRVPGDEFRSIVTAIMQAEQYGTSVSEILRYQVQQIRTFNRRCICFKMRVGSGVREVAV